MSTEILKVFCKDDDLVFVTDTCPCNGRIFVEAFEERSELDRWVTEKELTDGGWYELEDVE